MRLVDLEPKWVVETPGRHGMGLRFWCPCCKPDARRRQKIVVWFANPVDGGPAYAPQSHETLNGRVATRWARAGDTFESLTLTPSIDFSVTYSAQAACGNEPAEPARTEQHWHGHITNGGIT